MNTISKKWQQMADIYKRFSKDFPFADFSDTAALNMYLHESKGIPLPKGILNGYSQGKKLMDITVSAWAEDIEEGTLFVFELLEDGYPRWFLERVGILNLKMRYGICKPWVSNMLLGRN